MNNTIASIITPLYNSAPYIADTIKSVQSQTYDNWEMIIVDDCSLDSSVQIAQQFANHDNRIKLFQLDENSGPAIARNKAISEANGRYISFLDSDDQWLSNKLEKQLSFMFYNNFALTHTYYKKINTNGYFYNEIVSPPSKLTYYDMLKSNFIGCLTAIYDTRILSKVYMPLIRKRQDYGLWLKILKKGYFAYCLPEALAIYRERSNSVSGNKIELIKYNWSLYRKVEKLSFFNSAYYLGNNIIRKIFS